MACVKPVQLVRGPVPCGRCNYCLQKLRNQWTFRLREEAKVASSCYFITLTYEESKLPRVNEETGEFMPFGTLCKSDVQKFMKRLRKVQAKFSKEVLRYYLVGEYGTKTDRAHYHIILFNVCQRALLGIESVWKLGSVVVAVANDARMHYITKFHLNKHRDWDKVSAGRVRPFHISRIAPAESALVTWLLALSGIKPGISVMWSIWEVVSKLYRVIIKTGFLRTRIRS